MRTLTRFTLFTQLPPELRAMIWKFHRQQRGMRHYITESEYSVRHYAAIDIETDLFARTLLTKRTAEKYWDEDDNPVKGESDARLRLIGLNYVPEPGGFGKSPTTARHSTTWRKVQRPYIRIHYPTDVVLLEATYLCLKPAFHLQAALPRGLENDHWLHNVRHLALGVASCRLRVEDTVALLANLRTLRLVVYRDPACPYGAPRGWRDFEKGLLDCRNFLPFADFVRLHPDHDGIECDCETMDVRVLEVRAAFRTALQAAFVDHDVAVSMVADPY
ncbi:hypothetical protein F5B21DRAFT_528739 [Xylaria acuta]|nr:hypothetical protein F5B21DRAFT_528739 [Xylaria acuta]